MAAQSKLWLPRDRTLRSVVADLTRLYVSNRTRISRLVWIGLALTLVNRVRHAVAEQKAASQRERAARDADTGTSSLAADDEDDDVDGGEAGKRGRGAAAAAAAGGKKRKKVELNREFFRSLLKLIRIVVPGWRSKETRLLISHSFFLVVRTLISLKVAAMDGAIVKALVKGNGREFLMRIVYWMLIAVPVR